MIRVTLLVFIALFLSNCSTKNLSPVNVTDYFWLAQKETNLEDAKKFVRENDQKNIALQKNIKIKRFTFSDAQQEGDVAVVPTKMYLEGFLSTAKKDEIVVDFDTVLAKGDAGWKVNLVETKKALYLETAKEFGTGLGSGIFGKLKESLGDLNGLQGVLEEITNGLKKSFQQ